MDVVLGGLEVLPQAMSDMTGAEISGARLFATLLYIYPLMLIERFILSGVNHNILHIYHTLTSAFLMYYNFGNLSGLFLINVLIIYAVIVLFKSSQYAVILSLIINMVYLCYGYLTASGMEDGVYVVAWTTPHCVLTLKLIGITWDVYDGAQKDQKGKEETALTEIPSLLEVLGFSYYPAGLMTGPQISFLKYRNYSEGLYTQHLNSSWAPAILKLLVGIILIVSYPLLSPYMPTEYFYTEQYQNQWLVVKIVSIAVWGQIVLNRYLGVWLVAEGSCILSGIAYNGKDEHGHVMWDACANIKLTRYMASTRSQHYIDSFNINTNKWVLTYIYKRLRFLNNKQISQGVSLVFLATWHGFETGYFMCFFLEFIIMNGETQIATLFEKKRLLKSIITNPAMSIMCKLFTKLMSTFTLGYALIAFDQLSISKFHLVYKNTYYLTHALYMLIVPVLCALLNNILRNDKPPTDKKAS